MFAYYWDREVDTAFHEGAKAVGGYEEVNFDLVWLSITAGSVALGCK
jgi:hypothetical protein